MPTSRCFRSADFHKLTQRFHELIGAHKVNAELGQIIQRLQSQSRSRGTSVVTLGGDQLTGKSSVGSLLAQNLQAEYRSAGTQFRKLAKSRGISVAELSRLAIQDPSIDTDLDYRLCLVIGNALLQPSTTDSGISIVLEGRQPAVMASYILSHLQNDEQSRVIRFYLSCSSEMRVRRFFRREISPQVEQAIVPFVLQDQESQHETLDQITESLQKNVLSKFDHTEDRGKILDALEALKAAQNRDQDDLDRYVELYGPCANYRDYRHYDWILDTSEKTPSSSADSLLSWIINQRQPPVPPTRNSD